LHNTPGVYAGGVVLYGPSVPIRVVSTPPGARPSGPLDTAGGPEGHARGWHTRGYLPHFDAARVIQSITYRLADALPLKVLDDCKAKAQQEPDELRQRQLRRLIERFLDTHHGSCVLRRPEVARWVIDAWRHFDGQRYHLHAWVVMPNHVHVVCEPLAGHELSSIIHSWKSFTAVHINRLLKRSGALWMEDYWDRYVRDADHYEQVIAYVLDNPVKAGLVAERHAWPWSSAAR
jgi:REP element-mobilizing transposase RayT